MLFVKKFSVLFLLASVRYNKPDSNFYCNEEPNLKRKKGGYSFISKKHKALILNILISKTVPTKIPLLIV